MHIFKILYSYGFSLILVFLLSCSETTEPQITTGTTRLNITLNNVGELSKSSEIQLADLYIHMNKGILDVYDTIPLNGNSEVLVSQNYVDMSEGLWTVFIESKDANSEVIHSDSTEFTVVADFKVDVNLTLISKYSMLIANFSGITDGVYRCELLVDESIVSDSAFTPQDILEFNITLGYDYLTTGMSHDISLDAYGEYESTEYLFYTCDTIIMVNAGEDATYELEMLWVGPYGALKGTSIVNVVIGAAGTTTMNADFPLPGDVLVDIDGNLYNTVLIGDQIWMAQNLKVSKYRNGDIIPFLTASNQWSQVDSGVYYFEENWDNNNYGAIYNSMVVNDNRAIAPAGWHIPTDDEWKQLEMYLGMTPSEADGTYWRGTDQGSQLAGMRNLWDDGILENASVFGSSGFDALPAGYINPNLGYYDSGLTAEFWTSSIDNGNNYYRSLQHSNMAIYRNVLPSFHGLSIRCVKD